MADARFFVYFDLGNVLLNFDHDVAARQLAEVSGATVQRVRDVVFESDLQIRYETGEITTQQFYDSFCEATQTKPNYESMLHAASAIFQMNSDILPIVAQLRATGYRLGILSNTCEAHWEYVSNGRYAIVPTLFDTVVLSYQAGCMKPAAEIYQTAADLAQVPPERIFYTDDREENVQGAIDAGFVAVQFTSAVELAKAMHDRGIRFNY